VSDRPRLLSDVQAEADRVAFYTRFARAMTALNAQDFTGEVERRITALQAAGQTEWAAAVRERAEMYATWAAGLARHPAAWRQMVEAMAQQRLEGGVGADVTDAARSAANGWLNAALDLFDVLRDADAVLAGAA